MVCFKLDSTLTQAWCIENMVDSTLPFVVSLTTGLNSTLLKVASALMTELVGSGSEKRCECFVILNAMLNLPKLDNFNTRPAAL